jgi:hypothetical protein
MLDSRDSTTYQAILTKGREEGRITAGQQYLIHVGTKKFGNADCPTVAAIEAIRDFGKLEALCERMLDPDVRDWGELLQTSRSAEAFNSNEFIRGVRHYLENS